MKLNDFQAINNVKGFVLTKATDTDNPCKELVVSEVQATRQEVFKLAHTFKYATRIQDASTLSVSNQLPTSDISLQGLWTEIIEEG